MENAVLTNYEKATSLKKSWEALNARQEKPLRIREAAEQLGVSEMELLATQVGESAIRLEGDWRELLKQLPGLGYVMSLTRNDACVLEHKGVFEVVNVFGNASHAMGTVIGPIETRVFFSGWHHGFAVTTETGHGTMKSLQFFDQSGTAITKVFLQGDKSNEAAYEEMVASFRSDNQEPVAFATPYAQPVFELNPDKAAFLADWAALKDTHDFFPMLRKHKVHRLHAVELAEGQFTHRMANSAARQIVEEASKEKLPIMIFAGNRGNLQIHQGTVRTIRVMGPWLNVLDPEFNMHLREDLIHTSWLVEKPTADGVVTSIELFDANRELIAQFFGLRKPGVPELQAWRDLVARLPKV
jgi:putative hemin transport protein